MAVVVVVVVELVESSDVVDTSVALLSLFSEEDVPNRTVLVALQTQQKVREHTHNTYTQ